jgi:hypothetical protein
MSSCLFRRLPPRRPEISSNCLARRMTISSYSRQTPPPVAGTCAILARSLPEDMRILVEMLKERGDILRFTRSGIDDGPALMNDDFLPVKSMTDFILQPIGDSESDITY